MSRTPERIEYENKWRQDHKEHLCQYEKKRLIRDRDKIYERQNKWREKNAGRQKKYWKNRHLQKTYGITLEQKESIIKAQDSCCPICGKNIVNDKTSHVDHDHKTGKLRGVLCMSCNAGMGLLGDSELILNNAIRYLRRYRN